ncbi:MAG: CvpA family protein [Calditrichaeota bacterium]|nr:MAG: CvpA family protein [Calditrichota bacterium]
MSHVDLLILLFLAYFAIRGLLNGFFKEIFRIIGFLGGILLAFTATPTLSTILQGFLRNVPAIVVSIAAFLMLFALVITVSKILASLLSELLKKIHLGWLNRLMGLLLGMGRGALILGLIFIALSFLPFPQLSSSLRQQSRFYQPLQSLVPLAYDLVASAVPGSGRFENRLMEILDESKVKITQEALKYFLYGKPDSSATQ